MNSYALTLHEPPWPDSHMISHNNQSADVGPFRRDSRRPSFHQTWGTAWNATSDSLFPPCSIKFATVLATTQHSNSRALTVSRRNAPGEQNHLMSPNHYIRQHATHLVPLFPMPASQRILSGSVLRIVAAGRLIDCTTAHVASSLITSCPLPLPPWKITHT